MTLTLRDLRVLCSRYVPLASRHPGSMGEPTRSWWYAHERRLRGVVAAGRAARGAA